MDRESDRLLHYDGPNPFNESQSRDFIAKKMIAGFFPTTSFWSLFNDQNEILVGSRGSGKTSLLKMMSYSLLKRLGHAPARKIVTDKSYISFYIPLHLEFIASLPGNQSASSNKLEYFQFAVNCSAAKALLSELVTLLQDCFPDPKIRLMRDYEICKDCSSIWLTETSNGPSTLAELQWHIEQLFVRTQFWADGTLSNTSPLARPILSPIISVLPRLALNLNLDPDCTQWIACIDEAEFLDEYFLRCLNTCLRSEKRPLVVKIATLPFKHSTCETTIPGVSIQPNGNDFNYRAVDLPWDSSDFCNRSRGIEPEDSRHGGVLWDQPGLPTVCEPGDLAQVG